jgi:hypothetical protein
MKTILSLLILLIGMMWQNQFLFAQSDTIYISHRNYFDNGNWEIDTLFYPTNERGQFLYGTAVLPSARRMAAANQGYWLSHVTKLPCSDEGKGEQATHAEPVYTMNDSTLTIDLTITDNCCFDFLCDASVNDEGEMRLYTMGYGSYCACFCCFGLQFHFILDAERQPLKRIYLEDNAAPIWTRIE